MARIRSIHPGLFRDEAYMSLSLAGKAAWPGIWTEADDHGVFEWKPVTLKATLLPADNVDMVAILDECVAQGLVLKFSDRGKTYGAIKGFMRWQRPRQPSYRFPFPKSADLFAHNSGSPDEAESAEGDEFPQSAGSKERAIQQSKGSDEGAIPQDCRSPAAVPPTVAPQREEGGGRRKEEGGKEFDVAAAPAATKRGRRSKLPADWEPTPEQLDYARAQGCVDPADTAVRFKLHHGARGTLGADWNLGFQYWCRNEKNFRKVSAPPASDYRNDPAWKGVR